MILEVVPNSAIFGRLKWSTYKLGSSRGFPGPGMPVKSLDCLADLGDAEGKPRKNKDHLLLEQGLGENRSSLPRWVEIRFHTSNVDLQVKLADFGCASSVDNVRAPAGSRKYWSPELLLYWLGRNSKT